MRRSLWFLLLPLALAGCGYNTIQSYDETAAKAKKDIEVQLQRRADLIPNLVNTVKGFAAQEENVLTEVTKARAGLSGAIQGGKMNEMADANQQLSGALSRLMVTVEAYPQLKSDQNFLQLQDELTGTENRIAVARKDYNESVGTYNAYIRKFPQVLTAKVTGAKAREYFEVTTAAARETPTVDFSKKP
ncbi:MAG: LemA family protein [Gemmatimonadaceae bacterium]